MDEPVPSADARDGTRSRGASPGTPRWVKVFAIVAAVVSVLFLVLLLSGSNHGPGRHLDGGEGPAPTVEHRVPHQ